MNAKIMCTCMKCGKRFEVDEESLIKVFFGDYPKYCNSCTTFNIVEKVGEMVIKGVRRGKK